MLRCRVKCAPAKQASIDSVAALLAGRRCGERARARGHREATMQQVRRAAGPYERGDDSGVPWLAPLLPPQLLGRPHRSPEQQLMAAVLEDAMRELLRPVEPWIGSAWRQRAELQAWFES